MSSYIAASEIWSHSQNNTFTDNWESQQVTSTYLIRPHLAVIKQHQDDHVIRRHLDDVFTNALRRTDWSSWAIAVHTTGSPALFTAVNSDVTSTPWTPEHGVQVSGAVLRLQAQLPPTVLAEVKSTSSEILQTTIWICSISQTILLNHFLGLSTNIKDKRHNHYSLYHTKQTLLTQTYLYIHFSQCREGNN